MRVSSSTKVANLNADRLDGRNSGAFLPKATYRNYQSTTGTDLPGGRKLANMNCDEGDLILSGGYADVDAETTIVSSQPYDVLPKETTTLPQEPAGTSHSGPPLAPIYPSAWKAHSQKLRLSM